VQLTVTGEPVAMGYCHCESCRHWSAGPVNAFTLWPPDSVRITRGADNIGTYNKSPHSYRKWCKTCGGHILSEHPGMNLTDVYAAVIPDLPFKAGVQCIIRKVFCRQRTRDQTGRICPRRWRIERASASEYAGRHSVGDQPRLLALR
jgi:hypothetical protein